MNDEAFLGHFQLDPTRQLIGSIDSGALLLAKLGLLAGKKATTYPTAAGLLQDMGVNVVEKAFVETGNIATAGGCLAAQELAGRVIGHFLGDAERDRILASIQPVGQGCVGL